MEIVLVSRFVVSSDGLIEVMEVVIRPRPVIVDPQPWVVFDSTGYALARTDNPTVWKSRGYRVEHSPRARF